MNIHFTIKSVFIVAGFVLASISGACASNTLLQVPTQQLRDAYSKRFGHAPDLNIYKDLELAIDTCIPDPQAWCGGIWDGFKTTDKSGAECYEVILCDARNGKKLKPERLAIEALFKDRFGHQPNFDDVKERALTLNSFVSKKMPSYAGAFWNGERGLTAQVTDVVGVVCVESRTHSMSVPTKELKATFARNENREPNLDQYSELSRSIVYWAKAHHMNALGGFWNGEVVDSNQGRIYGIVFLDAAP